MKTEKLSVIMKVKKEGDTMFYPLTASPFKRDQQYIELTPCPKLAPFVRCFWGNQTTQKITNSLVIPDLCVDLVFRIWKDKVLVSFIGVNDEPFVGHYTYEDCCTFGIRFYAWTALFFSEANFSNTKNQVYEASSFFGSMLDDLLLGLIKADSLEKKKFIAEMILLDYLKINSKNLIVLEAVDIILSGNGMIPVHEVASEIHVSDRQLERLFLTKTALSPKKFSSLVRYQSLWSYLMTHQDDSTAQISTAFGFSDQAHLCREFKKYHGMNLKDAKRYAYKDVAFIQENE